MLIAEGAHEHGWPRELFLPHPFTNVTCMICHETLRDPVHCKDDHHFCRVCLVSGAVGRIEELMPHLQYFP